MQRPLLYSVSLAIMGVAFILKLKIAECLSWAYKGVALVLALNGAFNHSLDCAHDYTVEFLSFDPVIMHINNFVKDSEIQHLLHKYNSTFEPSKVVGPDSIVSVDKEYRSSKSAYIDEADPVASCLMDRMRTLLGNYQHIDVELPQLVKYDEGNEFRLHYDWFPNLVDAENGTSEQPRLYNRLGTIFAYLGDNCTGGGTFFPHIKGITGQDNEDELQEPNLGMGLVIKPKRGNAVFWNNLHMNGSGDERVLHAGLPVRSGTKYGLNLWSKYYPDRPMLGLE